MACLFLFSIISLTIEINRAIISILDISIVEVLDERKSAQVRPLLQSGNIGTDRKRTEDLCQFSQQPKLWH